MDPVIIVGAGPGRARAGPRAGPSDVPSVVLDEGTGHAAPLAARTVVLRADTAALLERLGHRRSTARRHWAAWRSLRRRQVTSAWSSAPGRRRTGTLPPAHRPAPPDRGLRAALAGTALVTASSPGSRLDAVEQETAGVTAHTRGPTAPGGAAVTWSAATARAPPCANSRTSASPAVRPWSGTPSPPCAPNFPGRARRCCTGCRRGAPAPAGEVTARPLPDGVWRLDWLLPAAQGPGHPRAAGRPASGRPSPAGAAAPPRVRTARHRRVHRPPPAGPPLARRPGLPRRGRRASARRARHAGAGRGAAGRRQPRLEAGPGLAPRGVATHCSTATRPSGAAPSPPGCAPPTRRCRCCGRRRGTRCGARTVRAPPAARRRCSRTATWAAARWARRRLYARSPLALPAPGSGRAAAVPAATPSPRLRLATRPAWRGRRRAGDGARRLRGPAASAWGATCWWCWSRRAPGCGSASTG